MIYVATPHHISIGDWFRVLSHYFETN